MKILIFSNLYRPEPTGIGPVTGELADALAEAGHQVHVIAANPSYPDWKLFPGYSSWKWSCTVESKVSVHRVPLYIPSQVGGKTRIAHYGTFAMSALAPAAKLAATFRPDMVMLVAPTLLAAPVALMTAKLSGARSWLHIQDFEVEAGFATGQLKSEGAIARFALGYERKILKSFDTVSSISPEMCAKLVEKGCNPEVTYELRNWADIDAIVPMERSAYREEFGITTPHVALYSGAIGQKQGLEIVVEAARELASREDLTFVICGNGPSRPDLEKQAQGLPNIQFHDLQPKERLGDLLNLATIHLLPQKASAADLLLPSKLTNMLASGRPVIASAEEGTGLAREVSGCGMSVEPGSSAAFVDALADLLGDDARREAMGKNARERALAVWDKRAIIANLLKRFEHSVSGKASGDIGAAAKTG